MKKEKKTDKKEGKKETKSRKKVEDKYDKQTKNKAEDKYDKQTKFAIIVMIVLILSIFLVHWIIQESKKFEYNGIKIYKIKEGNILFYKTEVLNLQPGQIKVPSGESVSYPFILKLRNDPRKLSKNIPIEGAISFGDIKDRVFLSVSPKLANCSNTYVTLLDFSATLKGFSTQANKATNDIKYARENNVSFIDCKNNRNSNVILIDEANETKIVREVGPGISISGGGDTAILDEGKKCITIYVNNCEIREGFERFILSLVANAYIQK